MDANTLVHEDDRNECRVVPLSEYTRLWYCTLYSATWGTERVTRLMLWELLTHNDNEYERKVM
jgi:hypothetical protein